MRTGFLRTVSASAVTLLAAVAARAGTVEDIFNGDSLCIDALSMDLRGVRSAGNVCLRKTPGNLIAYADLRDLGIEVDPGVEVRLDGTASGSGVVWSFSRVLPEPVPVGPWGHRVTAIQGELYTSTTANSAPWLRDCGGRRRGYSVHFSHAPGSWIRVRIRPLLGSDWDEYAADIRFAGVAGVAHTGSGAASVAAPRIARLSTGRTVCENPEGSRLSGWVTLAEPAPYGGMPVPIFSSNSNVSVGSARVAALASAANFAIYVRGGFHGTVELSARSLTNRVTQTLEVLPSWDDRCSYTWQFLADPHPLEFLDELGMCLPCIQALRVTDAGVVLGRSGERSWIFGLGDQQLGYLDQLLPGLLPRGTAISDHGRTVGLVTSGKKQSGFLLAGADPQAGFIDLGGLVPASVNDAGFVAGHRLDAQGLPHAVQYRYGVLYDVPVPAQWSYAVATNEFGTLAGTWGIGNATQAFVGSADQTQAIHVAGATSSYAVAISNAGDVAGTALLADGSSAAFVARPNQSARVLGALPGLKSSSAVAVNGAGIAIGYAFDGLTLETSTEVRPFLADASGMRDLRSALSKPQSTTVDEVIAILEDGSVLVRGALDGTRRFFLLRPVPE